MKTITRIFSAIILSLTFITNAQADTTLLGSRIGAKDVPALAEFYKNAFGLHEVNRLQMGPTLEIMLNFGDTVEAAQANQNAQVVILGNDAESQSGTIPNLIFSVSDFDAAFKQAKDAGGVFQGEPIVVQGGVKVIFGTDPAGNQFEIIHFPAPE